MRRRRGETIEADNEEEYLKILYQKDEQNENLSERRKKSQKIIIEEEEDEDEDEYNLLKPCSNYFLEKRILSIEEQEKKDEDILNNKIKELNLEKYNEKNSMFSKTSLSTIDSFSSPEKVSQFYEQNIINFNEKVKIIIIGKAKSGKSLFIEKFSNNKKDDNINLGNYNPTISLEYKNTFVNINNSNIKIEFIDTNDNVISSNLIQTYFKICNGYIIITKDLKEDYNFIQEKIILINSSVNDPNILIIINHVNENIKNEEKYFPEVQKLFVNLLNVDKHNIDLINFINIIKQNNFIRRNRNCKTVKYKFNLNVNQDDSNTKMDLFKNLNY